MSDAERSLAPAKRVKVWDFPSRLSHWLLAGCIVGCFGTAEYGWLSMQWHFYFGEAVIVLALFRILWGFFGSEHARFRNFLRGPGAVWRYARGLFDKNSKESVGHSAVGGWAVVLLLLASLAQGVSGLFNSDDIFWFGPLSEKASAELVEQMSAFHGQFQQVLLLLIGVHVIAALLYFVIKKQNLILPMITGTKRLPGVRDATTAPLWRALVLLALSGAVLWLCVRYWPMAT
jgi:cytochrome b